MIDHAAGIVLAKKTGDYVKRGDLIATLYTNKQEKLACAVADFLAALTFSGTKPETTKLIYKVIR